MLDPDRPIYRHAPLKLVTFQIRFPPLPDLDDVNPPRDVAAALRERYPILSGNPAFVHVDVAGDHAKQRARGSRLMNRSRTLSLTLSSDAIAVETSRYERYEWFAEQVEWVLHQVHKSAPIPAVTRLGLRYIDEIEIDGIDDLDDWRPWIHEDLLAGGLFEGYRTTEYLAQAVLQVDTFRRMTIRYGRIGQPVVDPNGVLRIENSPTGPYFLLDIDSYWEPSEDEFREFDAREVGEVCLALHEPIHDIFERATTSALRERFGPEEQP